MPNSIEYYNYYSDTFKERTIDLDMQPYYQRFVPLLPKGGHILDAGCGVGRDARYFKHKGFKVTAFDASPEMVRLAKELTEDRVLECRYQDLQFKNAFDGIWASASLLHIPYDELNGVFVNLHSALKDKGIFFGSFKYGDQKRHAEKRTFYDMNEKMILPYFKNLFHVMDMWQEVDKRSTVSPSPDKKWLYFLCRKT